LRAGPELAPELRSGTPLCFFCAARAAIERHLFKKKNGFRVLEAKTRLFLMARVKIIFSRQAKKKREFPL